MAIAQRKKGDADEALKNINTAMSFNENSAEAYCERAIIYQLKNELLNAENDFATSIKCNDKKASTFYHRGLLRSKQLKTQDAIGDFTNAILLNEKFAEAMYQRAFCFDALGKFAEAKQEFNKAKENNFDKKIIDEKLQITKQKEYEFNKESNNPEVELATKNNAKTIKVARSKSEGFVRGSIKDQSNIKSIAIDGVEAKFDAESNNPKFEARVPIANKEKVTLEVTDIYSNKTTETIDVVRTEDAPPKIYLKTPYINSTKEIIPDDAAQKSLYIEGKINDESLIASITVNGKKIEFNGENTNPTFSETIDIKGVDTVVIIAVDIYENSKKIFLSINRKLAELEALNPMGRTVVVLVENSNYESLTPLEGSAKDVSLLKSTFGNYNISKIIHKQNMTKAQMERFFSIELRDMVNNSHIKSLMVWYAGHGKYVNETGYWIPTDAS